MLNFFWVAFGGALGSVLRYSISLMLPIQEDGFPKATFISNVLASLFLGVIVGLLVSKFQSEQWLKYFLLIGFCGGFSTFSTYILEIYKLNFNGFYLIGFIYLIGSIVVSFMALFVGLWFSKILN